MAHKDLQEFISRLETLGQLKRIREPVEADLEIAEITTRVSRRFGPALLFENVEGFGTSVLTNAFGSMERMYLALGIRDLERAGAEAAAFFQPPAGVKGSEGPVDGIGPDRLRRAEPVLKRTGRCQEIIFKKDEVDLGKIPVLRCWPGDAGPFITLPLVFTAHPETGARNVGMYRMQVYDRNTTGMHWYPGKGGARHYKAAEERNVPLEAAAVIGPDPVMTYAATVPLPDGVDEVVFAGFLRGVPVELVQCITVDLRVPACAQIVLEGLLLPGERKLEGPCGNHTGFYSAREEYPVFHVKCITMRKDAVYPATVPGPPPQEDCFLAKATERLFLPVLKKSLPEIKDINLPLEGIFNNTAFVSMEKRFPGHGRKLVQHLWEMDGFRQRRIICVFDRDVDIQDQGQVLWRLGNNIDPCRDVFFSNGPADPLNPAVSKPGHGSRMGVDCTRKWKGEDYDRNWPEEMQMDMEVAARVDGLWKRLGF